MTAVVLRGDAAACPCRVPPDRTCLAQTCSGTLRNMEDKRSVKISIMLSPLVAAQLDEYARRARWSRSNAAAVLVEAGLKEQAEQDDKRKGQHGAIRMR